MTNASGSPDERLAPLIDIAIRRYFSRLVRRYAGLLVGVVVLALVVVTLPSRERGSGDVVAAPVAVGSVGATAGVPGANANSSTSPTLGAAGPTGVAAGPGTAAAPGGAPGGAPAGDGTVSAAAGVARSGVTCGAGVRQVDWLAYAAPCVPKWEGDNGGATAHGVTADTITIVFRKNADLEAAAPGSMAAYEEVYRAYADLFNANCEFYGRKMEVKTFDGQGAWLNEMSNSGQAAAQSDAQTAHDMGAFADLHPTHHTPYYTALAAKGIMFGGLPMASTKYALDEYAPYAYGTPAWSSADNWGYAALGTICQRMIGMPAIFSDDPIYQKTTRVFGLVTAEDPGWKVTGEIIKDGGKRDCGLEIAQHSTYTADPASEAQQATPIIAQMKAAGVTTVVAPVDPIMAAFLMVAADQQNYYPEWMPHEGYDYHGDTAPSARQLSGIIKQSVFAGARAVEDMDGYKAYRLARPDAEPPDLGYMWDWFFYDFLTFANGIQAAGPNLTPETFAAGMHSLPPATGPFGLWRYDQPGWQNPQSDFILSAWDPNAIEPFEGNKGDFRPCNGCARYPCSDIQMGSGQLDCPNS